MKKSFVIRGIDPETVRIAKSIAAKKGMSLNDFILLAIREGLEDFKAIWRTHAGFSDRDISILFPDRAAKKGRRRRVHASR